MSQHPRPAFNRTGIKQMNTPNPSLSEMNPVRVRPTSARASSAWRGLALVGLLLAALHASAQSTYYWVGRDTSPTFFGAFWSYNNNFSTSSGGAGLGSPIPSLQNYLNFDGAAVGGYTSTNDFAAGSGGFQIYFKTGASAYNLYGNSITFYNFGANDPNIQNEGAFTNQTIHFPIVDGNTSGANGVLNINLNSGTAQGPLTFNGPITSADAVVATRAINVSGTNTVTFNNVISDFSGSGKIALTQLGTGTTTLNGTNTYTGDTTISAGTITVGSGGRLGSGSYAGNITDNGALIVSSTNSQTLSGNISGTGSVTKSGTNSLTLTGSNSYSGGTTLNTGGTININTTNAIGTGTFTVGGSSTFFDNTTGGTISNANNNALTLSGGSPTFNGSNSMNFGNGTVTVSGANRTLTVASNTLTLGGGVNDAGGARKLTKAGAGALVLNGAAGTWTGGSSVDAGTLTIGTDTTLGTGNVALNGGTLTAGNGARVLANSSTLTASSTIGGANNLTINGGFTNSGGSRTLTVLNTGTTTLGGSVFLSDDNTTSGRVLTFSNIAPLVISGSISNNNAGNTNLSSLAYLGTNTLTLSGANNYSGGTTISGGTLIAASTNAFGTNTGTVTFSGTTGTTILDIQTDGNDVAYPVNFGSTTIGSTIASDVKTGSVGINHTLGSLGTGNATLNVVRGPNVASGNPSITFGTVSLNAGTAGTTILNPTTANLSLGAVSIASGSNPKTLQLDGTSTNNSVTGIIANNLNVLTIFKNNSSTWTLSNAGNSYSGNTTVGGGTLNLTGGSGVTNGLFVNNAGTLNLSGTFGTGNVVNNFIIGQTAGRGVLNILTGATIPRANMFVGDGAAGDGAVYQTGGTVTLSQAAGVDNLRVGSTTGGKGYYRLTGGSVTAVRPAIGAHLPDTIGVFDMTNGTLTSTEQIHISAGSATSSGLLNILGGTVNAGTDIRMFTLQAGTAGATQLAVLNVGGGTGAASVTTGNNAGQGVNMAQTANIAGEISVVNLLANGTLTTSRILGTQLNPTLHFNFNGGKLKANTTVANPFFNDSGVDAINVFANGGTIDNSGVALNLGRPLLAPTGTGVTSITGPSTQGSNYIGAPLVVISGGTGIGATAYAVMADDGSGKTFKVAAIVVTSPGLYSVAPTTVTLLGGGPGTVASGFTINSAANTSGGMTFIGAGATTLNGFNTYTGSSLVSAGELIGQTGGSSSNSAVTVAAGATNGVQVLAANGQWVCSSLAYSAGATYVDFNFSGITPSTTTAPLRVNGNLALTVTPNIIVRSAGPTLVGQYPLIKYTGTLSGTPPTVALSLPPRMSATISNNVLNSSIDLVVTVGNAVQWAVGNAAWDINTTANWKNSVGAAVNYLDGDAVVLDDTASGASPLTLTLSASVTPISITANLTNKNYTIASNAFSFLGSGPLTKNGSGTLTITSTNNLFTGGIILNSGTIINANRSTLGSGTVTLASGASWLLGSGGNTFVSNPINVAAGASVSLSAQGGLGSAFQGLITGDSASTINIVDTTSFDQPITQLANYSGTITVNSTKTLRFSNTTGGTSFGGSNVTFNVLGTLQPRDQTHNIYLGVLTGSGALGAGQTASATVGTVPYFIGTKNVDSTFSGTITDRPITNFVSVTKVGSAVLTLSGNNTYWGATTVSSGTLMGVTGGSCSNSSATVSTGATNGVSITTPGGKWTCTNLTYAAGTEYVMFSFGANTPSTTVAPLQVQNTLTISGSLGTIVSGGSTTIPVGTYPLIQYGVGLSLTGSLFTNPVALPVGISGYITNDSGNKLISLVVTNVSVPNLTWVAGTGNWDASSINWTNVSLGGYSAWIDSYLAQFDDSATGAAPYTVTLTTTVNPIGVLVTNNTSDYTLAGGIITGSGALTKAGTGKLTLLTTNGATGGIVVSGGTLQGNSATLIGSIANNAALVFDQSFNGSNSAAISGSGTLTKTNSGTLVLGGNSTFTGNVSINQGTVAISSGSNLGGTRSGATPNAITIDNSTLLATNGAATITLPSNAGLTVGDNGATIDVASGTTLVYPAQAVSGAGNLTKNGAGTFQMDEGTASSTYTNLTLNAGTVAFNKSSGGLGAGSLTINGGVIRTTTASSRSPNNPSIFANADFTLGSSTTAAITFTGGGAWMLANGTRTITVDTIVATITGTVGDGGNNYGLTKAGSGVLALNGVGSWTGATLINAGALKLGNNLGAGTTAITAAGTLQIANGIFVSNNFTATQTFESMDVNDASAIGTYTGTATATGGSANFRFMASGAGATLVFSNATVNTGSKNLWPTRGNIVYAGNSVMSSTVASLIGRSAGNPASLLMKDTATGNFTAGFKLGEGGGINSSVALTMQDSASLTTGTSGFDFLSTTVASSSVSLNGGTLAVGSFSKTAANAETLSLNGGTIKANASSATFFPSLAGLTANVSTNGGTIDDNGFAITIAQPLIHDATLGGTADGGLTKSGAGTNTLSGSSTYTGPTVVNAGTLLVNGSLAGSGAVTVINGATLGGNGAINGAVIVNGTLAPGTSIGTLTLSNAATLNSLALMEINRTNAQTADRLLLTSGTVTYGGTLTVTNLGTALQGGDIFTLFSAPATSGVFAATNLPTLAADLNWRTTNNFATLIVNQVVPGAASFTRAKGLNLKIRISDLLTNVASVPVAGDTFTLASAGTSTNGATISTNGTYIFFTSTNDLNESFTYSVADTRGGVATGLITVNVISAVGGPQTITVSGSTVTVNFAGIPGYPYNVQRSTNLLAWVTLLTTNAPAAGLYEFTDDFSDLGGPPSSAYYRTAQP